MTITISRQDPRSIKAAEIAAGASHWLKCHTADGRKVYGVPSQATANAYHLADTQACTCCVDFQRHQAACKHSDNGLGQRLTPDLTRASTDRKGPENEPSIRWWRRRPRPCRSGGVT